MHDGIIHWMYFVDSVVGVVVRQATFLPVADFVSFLFIVE